MNSSDTMSKLWTTLKSVVGGVSPAAVEEVAAAASTAAVSSASAPPAPSSSSDGMLQGFAAIKPHLPMIKFRQDTFHPTIPSFLRYYRLKVDTDMLSGST